MHLSAGAHRSLGLLVSLLLGHWNSKEMALQPYVEAQALALLQAQQITPEEQERRQKEVCRARKLHAFGPVHC